MVSVEITSVHAGFTICLVWVGDRFTYVCDLFSSWFTCVKLCAKGVIVLELTEEILHKTIISDRAEHPLL